MFVALLKLILLQIQLYVKNISSYFKVSENADFYDADAIKTQQRYFVTTGIFVFVIYLL